MSSWSLMFLMVAFLAALLGFSGLPGGGALIARMVFLLLMAVFLLSMIRGRRRA